MSPTRSLRTALERVTDVSQTIIRDVVGADAAQSEVGDDPHFLCRVCGTTFEKEDSACIVCESWCIERIDCSPANGTDGTLVENPADGAGDWRRTE